VQTLTLKIPPELSDWLDKRSRELNRSKSEIVREALLTHRGRETSDSVTARASDLVGKFASGRKDSSHKKHLQGFGLCKCS